MPLDLTPDRGLLFRIVHIDNLPWLLANGLPCAQGPKAPNFIAIGSPNLIEKRTTRIVPVPPGGTLADYIPFYFTPRSPMLLNIRTGYGDVTQRSNDEIVVLVTAIPTLVERGVPFLFTDRHAFVRLAQFSANVGDLPTFIDWAILCNSDFRKAEHYPDKMERYMAEALVHRHLPVGALRGIVCNSAATQRRVETLVQSVGLALRIASKPNWYFQ